MDPTPRFEVDHMLEKLGKYLRILGFDADWERAKRTHELVEKANAEGRVFLTRNSRVEAQFPRPESIHFVRAEDPVEGLREVVEALGLDPRARLFARCIRCNVELEELSELGEHAARVIPEVRARHRRFWRCPRCGTIFWRGTHVENTCAKLGIPPPEP